MPRMLEGLESVRDDITRWQGGEHTTRHVDVNRHNPVTASYNRVTVVVVATAVGTTSHADNPTGIGHLIIDLAQSGSHLVCQSTGHNHNIGLTRRSTENDSEAILIVAGSRKVHHLDGTACKTEGHGPQRALTSPVSNLIKSSPRIMLADGQSECVGSETTNRTYCMAPSFFSWLGRATSVRTLPDAVNWPVDVGRSSAVADLIDEVERAASGWARGRASAKRGRAATVH
jgi:hypothetical protein